MDPTDLLALATRLLELAKFAREEADDNEYYRTGRYSAEAALSKACDPQTVTALCTAYLDAVRREQVVRAEAITPEGKQ